MTSATKLPALITVETTIPTSMNYLILKGSPAEVGVADLEIPDSRLLLLLV
jgi:hypothetical protein